MSYYIGADLGTSALKLILADANGQIIKSVTKDYELSFPNPGWSEQSPLDWWNALKNGIGELTEDINSCEILGMSVAGQMHGLVILDENDEVIRPAILWNDGRTFEETEYLNSVIGKSKLSELTANIAFAGFTAPKILWLEKNEKDNFNKICKIMLPKDYINYRLTGAHATDYSDASGMLLVDVKNKCWSKEMLDICKVKEEQMPRLFESYECIGALLPEIANELGLSENTKVSAGAGDNAAAAIGTGAVGNGECNISLGTSGTVFITSKNFCVDENNALHSFCHADGDYHLMGCILSAASCNKWFCDDILKTKDYSKEQTEITDEMLGNNHIYFLPYLMGERSPINDTDARGLFIGMRADTKRSDMVLAVLEGVAFAIKDNMEIAKSLGINVEKSFVCGGGAKSELWCKILCNVLDITLKIPDKEEGPGMGAAMLSMVGCGEYDNIVECSEKLVKIKGEQKPDKEIVSRYEEQYKKYKKIYPSVKELYKEIK